MKRIPDDSIVRLIDLPPGIGGAIMEDEDGFVSIYINARHGYYAQIDDLEHEITHIENDDLHSEESVSVIEDRAEAKRKLQKLIPQLMKASDLLPKSIPFSAPKQPPVHPAFVSTALTEQPPVTRHIVGFKLPPIATGEVRPPTQEEVDAAKGKGALALTPHQARVLMDALNELDRFCSYYDDDFY